nr:hypothetical protein [Tanacetum cinerariifolium]
MSDSDESGVTYTDIFGPFEELSDIGSPRANDHEHLELPEMLKDRDYVLGPEHADDEIVVDDQPYAEDASPNAQSPEYVLDSDLVTHPEDDDDEDLEEDPVDHPVDGGDDGDDEEGSLEDDEDDDMDIEADEEEEEEDEHPAPADSVVVASTAADQAPSAEETEPFKTDESVATLPPHPAYRMTARISIPAPVPMPAWSDSEIVRLLAMSSPPASPLSLWSLPPPQIPFPPLPPILSPPSPVLSPAPPPSPTRSLVYRAAMIRLRVEAASTSHSPPLPPPFILSPTRADAPSLGTPLLLLISASTSSPPLQLPSAFILSPTRADAPSLGTPLLLLISASTSSPPLQLPSASRREDRPEVTLPPQKRLGITLGPGYEVGESSSAAAARPTGGLRADYGFVTTMDREIMHDPEREIDASDLVRGEVMSLRTTVLGQMIKIRELHTADRRRQIVISELLRADHRISTEITELRTALQGQVTALQGQ